MTSVEYKGIEYRSILAMCIATGQSYDDIRYKRKSRMDIGVKFIPSKRKPIPIPVEFKDLGIHITFRGKKYLMLKDVCEEYDISISTFNANFKKTKCHIKAIEDILQRRENAKIIYQEKEYKTMADFCRHFGLEYVNTKNAYNKGVSLDDLVMKNLSDNFNWRNYSLYGVSFLDIIPPGTVLRQTYHDTRKKANEETSYEHIVKYILDVFLWKDDRYCGMDSENNVIVVTNDDNFQVISFKDYIYSRNNIKSSKSLKTITIEDTIYTIKEASIHFKIPEANIRARIKYGWSPEEVVGIVKRETVYRAGRPITIKP